MRYSICETKNAKKIAKSSFTKLELRASFNFCGICYAWTPIILIWIIVLQVNKVDKRSCKSSYNTQHLCFIDTLNTKRTNRGAITGDFCGHYYNLRSMYYIIQRTYSNILCSVIIAATLVYIDI